MLFFLFFSFFTDGGCSQCSNGLDFFDSGSVLAPILKNIYIFRNGDTDSSFFDSLKSKIIGKIVNHSWEMEMRILKSVE